MKRKLLLPALLLACLSGYPHVAPMAPLAHAQAQSLPPEIIEFGRRVDWTGAGITGGIPYRANGTCATLDSTATVDDINAAIAACNNGVVYLNAGTYNLTRGITFRGSSHVTLRGAGPGQTILKFTGSDPCGGLHANICVIGSSVWSGNVPPGHIRNWTGEYSKGATQITIDSTAGMWVGMVVILDQLDDIEDTGGVIVSDLADKFSLGGRAPGRPDRAQQQFVQVTAIDGDRVTISPGLYMPNWRASQQPQVWWWGETALMNGIEDLTVDHTSSTEMSGIKFQNAYNGWVKNVKSLNPSRNHVWFNQAARIEVRDSYFYGTKYTAAQSYGVESFTSSDDLVMNNIFHQVTSPLMLGPSSGSVFAYNYTIDMPYFIPTWMMAGIVGSHDAGTGMNLFEGNVSNQFTMDLYHGTGNFATVFRNRLSGRETEKLQWANTIPISIWAFNRFINVVGNVLGTLGEHFIYEDSVAPTATRGIPDRSIYVLGFSATGEYEPLGNDPLVMSTMLRWGNYDYATNQTHWNPDEIPAGHHVPATWDLPASLFLTARPVWWGTMPWPAIGPDVTGGNDPAGHAHKIPAQVCYEASPTDSNGVLLFDAYFCYPPP
jgi:hypothetical protein